MLLSLLKSAFETQLDLYVFKHFHSGYHPLVFLTEPTVHPRGCWLSYKVPVSYYSSNTRIFLWPLSSEFWVSLLRESQLLPSNPIVSYKKISSTLFHQVPYWCSFSASDFFSYIFTGTPNLKTVISSGTSFTFFENSWFEVQFISRPFYFDYTWKNWYLKTGDASDTRWGVSTGQIKRRIFFIWFWVGYWVYLLYDTPWPWRILYPRELSNLSWLKDPFFRFFRLFNPLNPWFLLLGLIFVSTVYILSEIFDYGLFIATLASQIFTGLASWLWFLISSLLLYFPIARLTKILYTSIKVNNASIFMLSDLVCAGSLYRRKRIYSFLLWLWVFFSLSVSLFIFYLCVPIWGPLVGKFLKLFMFIGVTFYKIGQTLIMGPLSWLLSWFPYNWIILGFVEYCLVTISLLFYYFAFFILYINFILWPFIRVRILNILNAQYPWAFAQDISVKTRMKFGVYLLKEWVLNSSLVAKWR